MHADRRQLPPRPSRGCWTVRLCEFDPHVEIHRFDGNILVSRGVISSTSHVRFRRYLWACAAASASPCSCSPRCSRSPPDSRAGLYVDFPGENWAYVRGYLDRLASAVLTAALITFVNLVFEYRDWKGSAAVIEWNVPAL